jgi:adenylylsulfate kinase
MLIVMTGLPGTGKSTLAAALAEALGGVVLNKDQVRAALFPPPTLDYSRAQDDLAMAAIYDAADLLLRTDPGRPVIVDGRTFTRVYQVRDLLARAWPAPPRFVHCVCPDEVVRGRLEDDQARGGHPAGNRDFALYQERKAGAEPLNVPHLVVDTGATPLAECVRSCVNYLRS